MGFPAQLDETDQHFPDEDTVTHFAAREFQIILRVAVVLSIIATVAVMATFWFWAWVPLVVLLMAWVALIVTNLVERRTRIERYEEKAKKHREDLAHELSPEADSPVEAQLLAKDDEHFTPAPLLKKEGMIWLEIVIGVALAALLLAFFLLPRDLIITGAVLFALYMLFVMGPIWLGLFGDVEDVERGRPSNERVSNTT